jgi:uncharacterized membrane protein (UPF0127 family)
MKKTIIIKNKKKRIKISTESCNFFKKFSGLMFSRREKADILLFEFNQKQKIRIHSLFVFYKFIAVWLDNKDNIIDLKVVKPFNLCISPKKSGFKLVEIPINFRNKKVVKLLVES